MVPLLTAMPWAACWKAAKRCSKLRTCSPWMLPHRPERTVSAAAWALSSRFMGQAGKGFVRTGAAPLMASWGM